MTIVRWPEFFTDPDGCTLRLSHDGSRKCVKTYGVFQPTPDQARQIGERLIEWADKRKRKTE